jgi:hypothetical protein
LLMKGKTLVKTSWTMSHVFELELQHEWCEFDEHWMSINQKFEEGVMVQMV